MSKASINDPIMKQTAQAWLAKLVSFDTRNGTGDEVLLARYLSEQLQGFNPDTLICEMVPRSRGKTKSAFVFARWGTPRILLNVHIDTVPSGEGWKSDPLKLRDEGDKLIGLGSSDIKGAAAAILAALGTTTPNNVAILFSGDEEHGSEVMPAFIRSGLLEGISTAIVCEPTGCEVGRRHRGMLAFSTSFSGPGGHSSLSDHVAAPLLQASRLASAIGDYGDLHREFGEDPYKGLCINIGEIIGDGAYNVIPTKVDFKFSMRPPPGDSVSQRETDIRAIAAKAMEPIKLDTIVAFPSFETKDVKAFEPYFGPFAAIDLPYWTEAAMLSNAGVNTVVYGPGDVEQAHRPNEYVTLTQLHKAQNTYKRALRGD